MLLTGCVFRDVSQLQALMGEDRFVKRLCALNKTDLQLIRDNTNTVIAQLLLLQPGRGITQRHLIHSDEFRVWDPIEAVNTLARARISGRLAKSLASSARVRRNVFQLKMDLDAQHISYGLNSPVMRSLSIRSDRSTLSDLFDKSVDMDAFCNKLVPRTKLTRENLEEVFKILDVQGCGKINLSSLGAFLAMGSAGTDAGNYDLVSQSYVWPSRAIGVTSISAPVANETSSSITTFRRLLRPAVPSCGLTGDGEEPITAARDADLSESFAPTVLGALSTSSPHGIASDATGCIRSIGSLECSPVLVPVVCHNDGNRVVEL